MNRYILFFLLAVCQALEANVCIAQSSTPNYEGVDKPPDSLVRNIMPAKSVLRDSTDLEILKLMSSNKADVLISAHLDSSSFQAISQGEPIKWFGKEQGDYVLWIGYDTAFKNNRVDMTSKESSVRQIDKLPIEKNEIKKDFPKIKRKWIIANSLRPTVQDNNVFETVSIEPIDRRVQTIVPSLCDLRPFLPYIGDQGTVWSCTAWAMASMVSLERCIKSNRQYSDTTRNDGDSFLSPTYIYQRTKEKYNPEHLNNCGKGIDFLSAFQVVMTEKVASIKNCPYYNPSSVCPPVTLTPNGQITENLAPPKSVSLNVIDFQNILSHRFAILTVLYVDDDFFTNGDKWNSKKPFIWTYRQGQANYYEHSVLCVGYNDYLGAFLMVNSKGTKFGVDGFFWIRYNDIFKIAKEAFRIESNRFEEGNQNIRQIMKKINAEPRMVIAQAKDKFRLGEASKKIVDLKVKIIKIEVVNRDFVVHLEIRDSRKNNILRQDFPLAYRSSKFLVEDGMFYLIELTNCEKEQQYLAGLVFRPAQVTVKITKRKSWDIKGF